MLILKNKVMVANTGDDTLTYIELGEEKKIENIDLKSLVNRNSGRLISLDDSFIGPYDIASNGKGYIYCTNVYNNSVFKMDYKNKKILDIISVGSYPTCIKYYKDHLFVTNSDSNSISIIDEKSFSLIENIPVGERPVDIEIDEVNMDIYVANSNEYSINVIGLNGGDNQVIKLNNNPVKIIIFGDEIYILSNINNGIINRSNISILDLKTYDIKDSNDFKGIFNNMIKINRREIIFITNMDNGYLYRMDLKKKNLLSKTYLAGMPNKLEWDGVNTLIISNISNNMLTLYDIDKDKAKENIKVGIEPNGILVFN